MPIPGRQRRRQDPILLPAGTLIVRPDEADELWPALQLGLAELALRGRSPSSSVVGPLLTRWRTVAELRAEQFLTALPPTGNQRNSSDTAGHDDEISTGEASSRYGFDRRWWSALAARGLKGDGPLVCRRGPNGYLISDESARRYVAAQRGTTT